MRLPMVLAVAMLLTAGEPARAHAAQTPHPAVVRVIAAEPGGASLGSGTLVDANDHHGLVITNWHVVRDAPQNVVVVFPDGFQSPGRVLRMDSNWDLAAILISRPRAAPVRVAREAPRVGEPLTIAGYGSGDYRAVAGVCTQYLAPSLQHPYELVELAASARQGDSGGPILNSRGELAGVLFGEGGGRTTGAYCGRVHSFLALATKQLHEPDAAVAAVPPARPPAPANHEYFTATATHRGNSQPASLDNEHVAARGEYWQAKAAAPGGGVWANGKAASEQTPAASLAQLPQPNSNDRPQDASETSLDDLPPSPGSFYSASTYAMPTTSLANSPTQSPATTPAPVPASVHSPATPSAAAKTDTPSGESTIKPVAKDATALDWRFFLGDTLAAQAKSVLAGLGILAVLFHGTRLLARTTTSSSKPPVKRAKR